MEQLCEGWHEKAVVDQGGCLGSKVLEKFVKVLGNVQYRHSAEKRVCFIADLHYRDIERL